jgi:glycosyltransferase involved in cell wall biosynthesis
VTQKVPVSLVVITLNEERNIERCLQAADFCSEIIVVDSGSTDRTIAIAERFGANIFSRKWTGYRDQKNFGSEQATQPWILCIDADEVVSSELRASILSTLSADTHYDGYEINRHSYYAGKLINHGGWYPQWRLFLYRRGKAVWGGEEPHTTVQFTGTNKSRLRGELYHYTYSSIREHVGKNMAAAKDWANDMHARGKGAGLSDVLFRAPWSFVRAYIFKLGMLDGFYGFVIAVAAGYYTFVKYAMLREMNLKQSSGHTES